LYHLCTFLHTVKVHQELFLVNKVAECQRCSCVTHDGGGGCGGVGDGDDGYGGCGCGGVGDDGYGGGDYDG